MRYHLTPVRMAITNKSTNKRMWRKGNPWALLVVLQTGTATVESSMELSQKIKNGTALWVIDSTSGNLSKETPSNNMKECTTLIFIAVLFTIVKILKQPCPSVHEWIKPLWDIYRMEYYSARKEKEIIPFATASMELENIMLSEISQSENDKYHMISLICGI